MSASLRKYKKAENSIRRNKLLDACLNGNGEIFKEIEKIRMVVATAMDGKKNHVEEHFKDIYEGLCKSLHDKEKIEDLLNKVNEGINNTHVHDVKKVTPDVVKEATKHLKDGKSDPVHLFS